MKLRFIRPINSKDFGRKNKNNNDFEMVYLREHESFGSKIIVEETTGIKQSIIYETFQRGKICIYQKSSQENALIRNKFQHIPWVFW